MYFDNCGRRGNVPVGQNLLKPNWLFVHQIEQEHKRNGVANAIPWARRQMGGGGVGGRGLETSGRHVEGPAITRIAGVCQKHEPFLQHCGPG
jgi:hypothetical protein